MILLGSTAEAILTSLLALLVTFWMTLMGGICIYYKSCLKRFIIPVLPMQIYPPSTELVSEINVVAPPPRNESCDNDERREHFVESTYFDL